jgi:hypothetical protein
MLIQCGVVSADGASVVDGVKARVVHARMVRRSPSAA